MMCALKSRLLLGVLKRQFVQEFSTCRQCLTRSRFSLTGNFRYCLQQQEDRNYDECRTRPSLKRQKNRQANDFDLHQTNDRFQNEFSSRSQASDERAGILWERDDSASRPKKPTRFAQQNRQEWRQKDDNDKFTHDFVAPVRSRDTFDSSSSRSDDELQPRQSEIPIILKPIKKTRSSDSTNLKEEAKRNTISHGKYKIVGGTLSEAEQAAHKKQFPNKKKQSRILENSTEINIIGEILFGIHPVLLALKARHRSFHKLYLKKEKPGSENPRIQEIRELASQANIPLDTVPPKIVELLSGDRPHQGVCLDASILQPHELNWSETESLPDQEKGPCLWLLLNNIVDPMNVGAILRSSYYFGVDRILTTSKSCRLSPVVSKASSGALEVCPPNIVVDVEGFLKAKVSSGWNVVGTCVAADAVQRAEMKICSVAEYTLTKPTILIIGNEGRGLDPRLYEFCSSFLTIYPGLQHSEQIAALNVGVATGIILHSLLKRIPCISS